MRISDVSFAVLHRFLCVGVFERRGRHEFDRLANGRFTAQIGNRMRQHGWRAPEDGRNGGFVVAPVGRRKVDEMFAADPQAGFCNLKFLPTEGGDLQDAELVSQSTRSLGFDLDAAGPVRPIAFAVVRAAVA